MADVIAPSTTMASNERILYGFWFSPFMSAVAQVLDESGLEYRYERVSPFQGATHSEQHTVRNPVGKIPSLQEPDGLVISDSQAICRYLARTYAPVRRLYPCDDPVRCAEVDSINDFITFSISGPFFNWFVVGGYFPKAFRLNTEKESEIFSAWSMTLMADMLTRLLHAARMDPYLLGPEPYLPDFQLFHILELGKTFSRLFDLHALDLAQGNETLTRFYDAMCERPSTRKILAAQAAELPTTERELFEEFGPAYAELLGPGRALLEALFGHPV